MRATRSGGTSRSKRARLGLPRDGHVGVLLGGVPIEYLDEPWAGPVRVLAEFAVEGHQGPPAPAREFRDAHRILLADAVRVHLDVFRARPAALHRAERIVEGARARLRGE